MASQFKKKHFPSSGTQPPKLPCQWMSLPHVVLGHGPQDVRNSYNSCSYFFALLETGLPPKFTKFDSAPSIFLRFSLPTWWFYLSIIQRIWRYQTHPHPRHPRHPPRQLALNLAPPHVPAPLQTLGEGVAWRGRRFGQHGSHKGFTWWLVQGESHSIHSIISKFDLLQESG